MLMELQNLQWAVLRTVLVRLFFTLKKVELKIIKAH